MKEIYQENYHQINYIYILLIGFNSVRKILKNCSQIPKNKVKTNKSTESALCEFHHKIVKALDNKKIVVGLFTDFTRAFDLVDHQSLIAKLARYGVRRTALQIFTSYLDSRSQKVKMEEGVESNACDIKQGVPQGSILGPLLYILFANDIIYYLQKTPNVHVVCYADDTNVLITGNN